MQFESNFRVSFLKKKIVVELMYTGYWTDGKLKRLGDVFYLVYIYTQKLQILLGYTTPTSSSVSCIRINHGLSNA
jgi:hypothetical protein